MREPIKQGLKRLLYCQLSLLLGMMILSYAMIGWKASYSVCLGGLVFLLPSFIFAAKLFRHSGAKQTKAIVRAFYVGEAWKLMISMALFAFVFIYVAIDPLTFFGSFIVMQLSHWLAPGLLKTR